MDAGGSSGTTKGIRCKCAAGGAVGDGLAVPLRHSFTAIFIGAYALIESRR
ncbi:MAG: hypothetical protein WCQ72_00830 [Eubacteriales bacterium]